MLDANDTIKTHKGIISRIKTSCHLHVVHSKTQQNMNSYKRGTSQIDFIMITPFLKKFLTSYIIQSFDYICRSDHRAMLISIDIKQLIQIITTDNKQSRAIQSTTPKQISLYKKIVFEKMSNNNIKNKINQINTNLKNNNLTTHDITTINDIDAYFTQVRLDAEKAIIKKTYLTMQTGQ